VDIFMPSMSVYRASGLLWLAFLVLTQVLFLNLVIDAFVSAYLEGSERVEEVAVGHQARAMRAAFAELAQQDGLAPGSGGSLSKATFLGFVRELSASPRMRPVEPRVAEVLYEQLGGVTQGRFAGACLLLQGQLWLTERDSCLRRLAPRAWRGAFMSRLRGAVWEPKDAPALDDAMNWVLLVNLALVVAEFATKDMPLWMKLADQAFTWVYVLEVLAKLAVKSWGEYWSSSVNQFDFHTTWLLLLSSLLKRVLHPYANVLRLMRLVRVVKKLKQYPSFQFMVSTIYRMVEAAGDVLSLLGVLLFFFTTLSVNVFGGLLYEGNKRLEGSAYLEKHWAVFNFNDSLMALGTWFTQLLNEYSAELAEAIWLSSAYGELAWLICPVFYVVGVAIIFEIVKAFTIETFLGLKEEADGGGEGEESEDEDGGKAEDAFQASLIDAMSKKLLAGGESLHCRSAAGQGQFHKAMKAAYSKLCEGELNCSVKSPVASSRKEEC